MKFLHLADLHIGKRVCEYNMLEDQKYVLNQVLKIAESEKPEAILIAGDIYDKSMPSAEAVSVLGSFLVDLSKIGAKVFIISGNHDSAERVAYGRQFMEDDGIFISPIYNGEIVPITLQDEFGEVDVWMLPFVKPADVRAIENKLVECESKNNESQNNINSPLITNYTDAIRVAISKMHFTQGRRNVLLSHQFVTGAERSDSEENVGGLDNVDASVFSRFDYVALGHLHKPQNVFTLPKDGALNSVARARYSGTPLKYSLSEIAHEKTVTIVEIGCNTITDGIQHLANLNISTIPFTPLHDMRRIRGNFEEITSSKFIAEQELTGNKIDDYIYIELTDELDVPDAAMKLRNIYKNFMTIKYDNTRTRKQSEKLKAIDVKDKSPLELFKDFYKDQNGSEMSPEQLEFMSSLICKIWDNEESKNVGEKS